MKYNKKKVSSHDRSDPITYFFRVWLNLNPAMATVIFLLLINVPLIISSLLQNALFTRGSRIGLFEDFGWWAYQLGTYPATFYAFMWLPKGINDVLYGLRRNKVIIVPSNDRGNKSWDAFINEFQKYYSNWVWFGISLAIVSFSVWQFWIPQQRTFNTWQSSSPFSFWYTIAAWIFIFTVGLLLIVRGVMTILWLNRLFRKFDVVVKILHPDGAGGLAPLGKFSVSIGYVLAIYGLGIVIGNFSQARLQNLEYITVLQDPVTLTMWIIYLFLAPLLFFLPLNVAHEAMEKAREEYISVISDQFDKVIVKTQSILVKKSRKNLKELLEKIDQLEQLHKIATKFPVWPFNTKNLVRFFSSVASPIVLSLISAFIDKVLK